MNEQNNFNNQFNDQLNNQINNLPGPEGLEMPREHIKKKFFSAAFLNDSAVDNTATGAFVPTNESVVTNTAFSNESVVNPIETLDDPPASEEIEELDVLEETSVPEEIEELDVLEEEKVEAPHPDVNSFQNNQAAPDQYGYTPSYNRPSVNQGPQVGVIKPNTINQNVDSNFGYNTQVVQPGVQNVAPVAAAGMMGATMVNQQVQAPSIESSAIFQAVNQQATTSNVIPANQMVDNGPVQPWMTNQPLSAAGIESTTIEENKVMSANQREELERRKNEPVVPVPTEITKPAVSVDIRPELLVKEYIGEDYTSLTMSPLNFGALFFGAAYFAYRKLYIWAVINIAIVGALLFFVPMNYNFLAILGFHLLMALAVNRIYILHVKIMAKGIARSNAKKKKPKTQAELEENMRYRGRVSFVNGLLAVCLFVAGIISISIFVLPNNDVSKLISKAFGGGNPFKIKELKYEGTINYDQEYSVSDLIEVYIPDGFMPAKDNGNVISYFYEPNMVEESCSCSFKAGVIKDFSNGDSYVVKIAAYNEEDNKISNSTTNGVDWTNYYTENDNNKIYYKGATVKNKALLIEYRIDKNKDEEVCGEYYLKIMDLMKLKED